MAMDGLAAGNYHLFRKRCTGPVLGLEACVGDRRYFTRFYLLYVVIGSGPFLIGMTLGKPRLPLLMFLSPPELVLALGAGNPNPDIFRGKLTAEDSRADTHILLFIHLLLHTIHPPIVVYLMLVLVLILRLGFIIIAHC
jgi:hypothetical protein